MENMISNTPKILCAYIATYCSLQVHLKPKAVDALGKKQTWFWALGNHQSLAGLRSSQRQWVGTVVNVDN